MQGENILILCTCPTGESAQVLARILVAEQVVACVNILPQVRSIYRWQGDLKEDAELLLLIKSRRDQFDAVERLIKAHHPYEVPEIIAIAIDVGSLEYLSWLEGAVA